MAGLRLHVGLKLLSTLACLCCPARVMRCLFQGQGLSSKGAAAMDVDGPAAQRESELACVSGELSEWTASDHRIQTLTSNVQQQQQQHAVQDG